MTDPLDLRLNDAIDAAALARCYARTGRVQIPLFLDGGSAADLAGRLQARTDWLQVVNSGDRIFELSRDVRDAMAPDQAATYDSAVYAGATTGFQFRYETLRAPDDAAARTASTDDVAAVATFLSSQPVIDVFRAITGVAAINFADAQATAFSPGDFLTAHDDAVAGKNRHAAYVLGLTPQWRPEWGGLLLFHDDVQVSHGFVPAFNTLNLFRVPQRHSVSEVTRAAPCRRYSVTGWLRSR